jgi:hypothetical protein
MLETYNSWWIRSSLEVLGAERRELLKHRIQAVSQKTWVALGRNSGEDGA